jgi:hypothetical protein
VIVFCWLSFPSLSLFLLYLKPILAALVFLLVDLIQYRLTNNKMVVAEKQTAQVGETQLGNSTEIDTVRLEAALGHKQELSRNFGLWSVTSLGIVIAKSVI